MSSAADRTRAAAIALATFLAATHLVAATRGAFRADDWVNLERGSLAFTPEGALAVWTRLNPFTLYRPLVDVWHAAMLRLFGLHCPPMLLALVGLLALQTWLLARLVRARGGGREVAALAAAAVWAQPNALAWTTQWVSNATGSLMTTFALLALLAHAGAVRRAGHGRGRAIDALVPALALAAGALCKEEIVLLPLVAGALEAARWRTLDPRARRAAIGSIATMFVVALAYAAFRMLVLPAPGGDNRYHLTLGVHVLRNSAFLVGHLAALPVVALLFARLAMPAAFRPGARSGEAWEHARREMLAGFGWTLAALPLYLPISGRPAYGFLYAPAFGVAYAVAHGLAWASSAAAGATGRPPRAVAVLSVHAGLMTSLALAGMIGVGWPRYAALVRDARATLSRDLPVPPPRARFAFLDGAEPELLSGRTLFNQLFDDACGSLVRLHYGRRDLEAVVLHGPAARQALAAPPPATIVYRTGRGRLVRIPAP